MTIILNKKRLKLWNLNDYYNLYSKERGYSLRGDAPLLIKIHPYYVELDSLIHGAPHRKIPIVSEYIQAVKNGTLDTFKYRVRFRLR